MATNFDKLKSEIAEMSAEEFAEFIFKDEMAEAYCIESTTEMCIEQMNCRACFKRWLKEESEGENDNKQKEV